MMTTPMPPVPALDAEGLTLILCRMLAQMEIQTELMVENARKMDAADELHRAAVAKWDYLTDGGNAMRTVSS